jgi:hypothetical protein
MTFPKHALSLLMIVLLADLVTLTFAGIPRPEQFFTEQLVDHLAQDERRRHDPNQYYSQRYYSYDKHFAGPGHPIFLILGGEGAVPPETGIFYPFVAETLAERFGAYVLEPEHRFYGKSQPLDGKNRYFPDLGEDPRVNLFTPEQALRDAMKLLDYTRNQLECSADRNSPSYCPIITVGGSYPGWLSAMARIMFPDIVDMAYAASAPMGFYAQQVDRFAYYDHITNVAEGTVPGCAAAVQSALTDAEMQILASSSDDLGAATVGICKGTVPAYIVENEDPNSSMVEELMMVIGYTFANDNMAEYPPSNNTRLYKECQTFTNSSLSSTEKIKEFLVGRLNRHHIDDHDDTCWNMTSQMPSGPHATISSGDWSGVGTGENGESWDFQTCTLLVEAIGFSNDSMFIPREWSMEWLTQHCQSRFGVTPQPFEVVDKWHFDDLVGANVTRILFTNGLKDGWSVSGVKTNLSDSLIALNFPNGAHHSDLSHLGPSTDDTDDIKEGYKKIKQILSEWLDDFTTPLAMTK